MSKIVRISDEIFERLQNYAEPFIDTPSTVIEKLLDYYEGSSGIRQSVHSPNLFLAPASRDNFIKTIQSPVAFIDIEHLLTKEQKKELSGRTSDLKNLHCWAMSNSNRSKYKEMEESDIVLFTIKGTGKFECYGRVIYKCENSKLGDKLWEDGRLRSWHLIYFLTDIKFIEIEKTKLVTELGYKENYVVPGVTRVSSLKLDSILSRFSSLDDFLESFSR